MYYSTNFTQGIHEIGELKYNRDGKYEVLSTTELFGDKLHIAHITSNNYDGGNFFVKVSYGSGSQYDPFTFEMIPPDALDIMTAEFITKGDFVDFGNNRLFRMEDHGFYSSSYFVEGVLKVEDISYDNGTYDIKVSEDHILIMSPYYGEDVGIKIDNESQSSDISFKIVYPVGKKYNVTWKNFDGTVINSEEIDIATTPVNNSSYYWQDEASRRIYANDALPMVVSDTVYKAVDNVKQLTKGLIFGIGDDLNFTDKYIIKDDIHSGTGENINSVDTVDGIDYNVNYEQYVFNMLSGNTIRVASENYGSENIALRISDGDGTSENPFRFEAVVSNIDHTVTWCDSDGNVLETDSNVLHGSKAEFNGIINVPENSVCIGKMTAVQFIQLINYRE